MISTAQAREQLAASIVADAIDISINSGNNRTEAVAYLMNRIDGLVEIAITNDRASRAPAPALPKRSPGRPRNTTATTAGQS
jgi:hypothetical protein